MKRITAIILALALCALPLCGCAGEQRFDASAAVTVITREDGSGTRGAFVDLLGIRRKLPDGGAWDYTTEEALVTNSTSNVMLSVSLNPHAVGYISLGSLSGMVKALSIDGVYPAAASVKDGSYPVSRAFYVATKGAPQGLAADFLAFVLSAEGQAVVEADGYVSVADGAAAYAGAPHGGKLVIAGSSSVTPVMEKLKEAYIARNPGVEIEIQQSDSSTGLTAAAEGICDIGMSSRPLKDSELAEGLEPLSVALDGIAVVVNNDNPFNGLRADTVRRIYEGELTTWMQVEEAEGAR
ncbi:MAG: substrate-binding domain-containing protein [Oscillospiraceae bacterium]|nr:substrate-binding domain-containing protein [Oscillospiraceae bacterium]